MAESASTRTPVSLDDLLSANRKRFDSLFQHQISGPAPRRAQAEPEPRDDTDEESTLSSVQAIPAAGAGENIVAELNKRFTITWSSEVLERRVESDRAVVLCKLDVGDDSRTESGSSRIGEDGDQDAAFDRALARALKKCADQFGENGAAASIETMTPIAPLSPAAEARRSALRGRLLDVVTMDRVETALMNARREMETVLRYSALSQGLRDHHAELSMIMDFQGNMIAGRYGSYVAHMLKARKLSFAPGDVLLQSDPYISGGAVSHPNDWLVLMPVFHGSDLAGFTSMYGHVADAGGPAAGSMPADAGSVFGEGLRIPPIKILQSGVLNESALQLILNNSRTPETNRADLMALIAGCRAGSEQVIRLCDRFGPELYHRTCTALLDRTNQAMRRLIVDTVPEEPQSFEDQVDDDGRGNGPFKLKLTVWREGAHAYFDWTGSSAQAPGPVNFYLHVGLAKMYAGLYLTRVFGPGSVCNDGFYELIHVTLPKGSLLNPEFPAAVGRRDHALARQFDVLGNALGRHRPEELTAASYGTSPSFRYAGSDFQMTETLFGGLPGRDGGDGMDGHSLWPDAQSAATEQLESNYPVIVEKCASIPDTGGAGLHRGGNGVEKIYRMLEAGEVSIHDDRHASRPWGIRGGKAGEVSEKWIARADGTREALPAKIDGLAVQAGDRIVFRTAGGGGCGDPLDRDPALVRRDVARGFLTVEQAGAAYGVILSGARLEIDPRATRELREGVKRERKPLELFDYGDPV